MSQYQIKYNMDKSRNSKWYPQVCCVSNISRRPTQEGAVCVCAHSTGRGEAGGGRRKSEKGEEKRRERRGKKLTADAKKD